MVARVVVVLAASCRYCGKVLRRPDYRRGGVPGGYGFEGGGLFCTSRCGYLYAVEAIRTGKVR